MVVRVDLSISLDGFATTTDQTPEKPFGEDWSRLVGAYAATRTMRERVFKDGSGELDRNVEIEPVAGAHLLGPDAQRGKDPAVAVVGLDGDRCPDRDGGL